MKVSILLLTFNEADNLGRCLDALDWCDDIAIVDSGSTDGTLEIAYSRNIRVLHRPFDNFASQRNFGLTEAGFCYDWVLHLDADEIVTEAFVKRLAALDPPPGIDAYEIPSKLMMFGKWLRHAGMYPVYQVRLSRAGMRFRQVGHGQREDIPRSRVVRFDEPYLHYSLSHGVSEWLKKHSRYAAAEAEELIRVRQAERIQLRDLLSQDSADRRRAAKVLSCWLPLFGRAPMRFSYVYFFRGGLLDGSAGLAYAHMLMVYEAMIALEAYARMREGGKANRKFRLVHRLETRRYQRVAVRVRHRLRGISRR
jgi:glycosyltransferase involved in cell wall biosynthesis